MTLNRAAVFTRQHEVLTGQVRLLAGALDPDHLRRDARPAHALALRLTERVADHLAHEDRLLYPALLECDDPGPGLVAIEVREDAVHLAARMAAYIGQWPLPACVQTDPEAYAAETKELFVALATLFRREERDLHPLLECPETPWPPASADRRGLGGDGRRAVAEAIEAGGPGGEALRIALILNGYATRTLRRSEDSSEDGSGMQPVSPPFRLAPGGRRPAADAFVLDMDTDTDMDVDGGVGRPPARPPVPPPARGRAPRAATGTRPPAPAPWRADRRSEPPEQPPLEASPPQRRAGDIPPPPPPFRRAPAAIGA